MESIVRLTGQKNSDVLSAEVLYDYIAAQKGNPRFYRKTYLLIHDQEFLILESLGQGRQGFVFLAYHKRRLQALKLSYEKQQDKAIFESVKSVRGDEYRQYFLGPLIDTVQIDTLYLGVPGNMDESLQISFDQPVFVSTWEPAESTLADQLHAPWHTKIEWLHRFLIGLRIIHDQQRAHFDIKLENLFLVNNQLKIGDFEFYFKIDDFIRSDIFFCGTPGHIAPEIFYDRRHISTKVDIFSAGVAFAQLFLGLRFEGETALTHSERQEMDDEYASFIDPDIEQMPDFRLNFKISRFYRKLLLQELTVPHIPDNHREILRLLLRMTDIDPAQRPTAAAAAAFLEPFITKPPGLDLATPVEPKPEPVRAPAAPAETSTANPGEGAGLTDRMNLESSGVAFDDRFARMLDSHDKAQLIKFCLIPDLLDRLKDDKIKDKIKGVTFSGDDYDKAFFSFLPLADAGESQLVLFGSVISSNRVKKAGDWNMRVIIDFWNRSFHLGLEKPCRKQYLDSLLDAGSLDFLDQELFYSSIKTTRKQVLKVWETAAEK